jgi:uncharacterized protein (DUF1697 family)
MFVALLRAVNVGGRRSVAMTDLREAASSLGFSDVRTVLQSGNVVFGATGRSATAIERALEAAIESRLGLEADCLVRTARQWAALVRDNPFRAEARTDPGRVVLMCLKATPDPGAVNALSAAITGPERLRAAGRELYMVYPDGIGRSRLTGVLIERVLGTRGTSRNWKTVLKLAAMLASDG